MVQKMTTLVFLLKTPHDELINVVYFVCSDLPLFFSKFAKTVQDADLNKNGHSAPSNNARTSLLKCTKASLLFFELCICVEGICKLFKPKTRIFSLVWNSSLLLYEKCTLYFRKITASRCQQLQTIELEALLSNPKFQANLCA